MNLALEITLEGGHQVLVTDVEDCLAWDPRDNRGWNVSLHPDPERPRIGEGPLRSRRWRGAVSWVVARSATTVRSQILTLTIFAAGPRLLRFTRRDQISTVRSS